MRGGSECRVSQLSDTAAGGALHTAPRAHARRITPVFQHAALLQPPQLVPPPQQQQAVIWGTFQSKSFSFWGRERWAVRELGEGEGWCKFD